jgi:hypothetical protein
MCIDIKYEMNFSLDVKDEMYSNYILGAGIAALVMENWRKDHEDCPFGMRYGVVCQRCFVQRGQCG